MKNLVPLLVIVGILTFVAVKAKSYIFKFIRIKQTTEQSFEGKLPGGLSTHGLGRYLRAGRNEKSTELESSSFPKICTGYLTTVRALNLLAYTDTSFNVTYGNLPPVPNGCTFVDEAVAAAETDYIKKCFMTNPVQADVINDACVQTIFNLRSSVTRMLHARTPVNDEEDLIDLSELLYFELSKESMNVARVDQILERILDLSPRVEGAEKLLILNAVNEKQWAKAIEALKELKKNHESDFSINELQALVETRGFESRPTLAYAEALLKKDSTSAFATFLMAFSKWKSNDHEDSYELIRKTIALAPGNLKYPQVLQQLIQPGAGDEVFLKALDLQVSKDAFNR